MALSVELHKKFKGFQMDVAFEHDGGSLGILGGSGMGKSMTLKMIAGLVKPDSGKVIVDGRTVYDSTAKIDMPARERHIGYLFQQYALFPTMTVAENIGIAMKKSGDEKKKEIDRLLEQFALQNLGGRMPNELSGGQQQRVALARILASEPQMLLLDEPFSALDSFLKEQLLEDMIRQLSDYAGDVIIVSHSRDEIYQFCDRLLILDQGRVIVTGDTKDIFDQPGYREAARLTGCKNITEARKITENSIEVPQWHCTLEMDTPVSDDIHAVGIRAHYIEVLAEKPENTKNLIEVTVENVSELPFEWYCFFRVPNGERIWWKVAKVGEHGAAKYIPAKGEHVYLRMPPLSIILLK